MTINDIFKEIVIALNNHNLGYSILRNYGKFDFTHNKDIDVLIDYNEREDILNAIVAVLIKMDIKVNVLKRFSFIRLSLYSNDLDRVYYIDMQLYATLKTRQFELKFPYFGTKVNLQDLDVIKTRYKDLYFKVLSSDCEHLLLSNHYLTKKKETYFGKLNEYAKSVNGFYLKDSNESIMDLMNALRKKVGIKRQSYLFQIIKLPFFLIKYYKSRYEEEK